MHFNGKSRTLQTSRGFSHVCLSLKLKALIHCVLINQILEMTTILMQQTIYSDWL